MIWPLYRDDKGYGRINYENNVPTYTHIVAYKLVNKDIPEGYEVDHLCRNRGCYNPAHLKAVPLPDNRPGRQQEKRDKNLKRRVDANLRDPQVRLILRLYEMGEIGGPWNIADLLELKRKNVESVLYQNPVYDSNTPLMEM